jgi:hypothetical protein
MKTLLSCLLLAFCAVPATARAEEVYRCQIGKPSYCGKYGGHLCEMWNSAPGKSAACARWTAACLDCHAEIPACFGHVRPLSTAPSCKRCSTRWHACMARIDRRFWPNRMTRK